MRPLLLLLCATVGCAEVTVDPTAPGGQPTVRIDPPSPPPENPEPEVVEFEPCDVVEPDWTHGPLALAHPELPHFAEVSRGHAVLHVTGSDVDADFSVVLEGWKLGGGIALADLALYAAKPLWFGGAIRPSPSTTVRIETTGGRLALTGVVDVRPHEPINRKGTDLALPSLEVPCSSIALRPQEYPADDHLSGKEWLVADGSSFAVGPDDDRIAVLRLRHAPRVHEVTRNGKRCRVALPLRDATLLGWLACDDLFIVTGRLGRSHRARPPRVRTSNHSVATVQCKEPIALEARRNGVSARVGTIAPGTLLRAHTEDATAFYLTPPESIYRGANIDFLVTQASVAKDCTVQR
jgi:hypothetical protein